VIITDEQINAFVKAVRQDYRDYTTTTGHKLFHQTYDAPACIWCGAPPDGPDGCRISNDGVFLCCHEHWQNFVNLPENLAWMERCQNKENAERTAHQAWIEEGKTLRSAKNGLEALNSQLQFDIGDWLLKRENSYSEASKITDYTVETLRNLAYVAKNVPVSLRVVTLQWATHALVAPLSDPEDQRKVLAIAVERRLSVRDVKLFLDERKPAKHIKPRPDDYAEYLMKEHHYHEIEQRYGRDVAFASMHIAEWSKRSGIGFSYPDKALFEAWETAAPFLTKERMDKQVTAIREHAVRLIAIADKLSTLEVHPPEKITEHIEATAVKLTADLAERDAKYKKERLEARLAVPQTILDVLARATEPQNEAQIGAHFGYGRTPYKKLLKNLVQAGKVIKSEKGYSLPVASEPVTA